MEQEVEDSKTKAKMHGSEVGKLSARIEALTQELAEAQDNLADESQRRHALENIHHTPANQARTTAWQARL